jgi:hypothetical protein
MYRVQPRRKKNIVRFILSNTKPYKAALIKIAGLSPREVRHKHKYMD